MMMEELCCDFEAINHSIMRERVSEGNLQFIWFSHAMPSNVNYGARA